mmetsp:Transcript_24513/g.48919  ORF Transcript_24513/g.48919 Transcript_24513/m.48919 type:complete len:229 (+) Transcript_24513:290-976(+)
MGSRRRRRRQHDRCEHEKAAEGVVARERGGGTRGGVRGTGSHAPFSSLPSSSSSWRCCCVSLARRQYTLEFVAKLALAVKNLSLTPFAAAAAPHRRGPLQALPRQEVEEVDGTQQQQGVEIEVVDDDQEDEDQEDEDDDECEDEDEEWDLEADMDYFAPAFAGGASSALLPPTVTSACGVIEGAWSTVDAVDEFQQWCTSQKELLEGLTRRGQPSITQRVNKLCVGSV